ncbi:hypothetical protein ACJIZ3_011816 [Penstemon smallii]|uniref:Uncharacterized protein n=1 Tax=Penstemon smallii TaxID=265156 RepID=A0ABD3UK69_9LAMI
MASPSSRVRGRTSSFLKAASTGNLSLFKQLAEELNSGEGLAMTIASMKDDEGKTALHCAAAEGKYNICDYLIKQNNLDIDMRDGNGETPLHHAVLGEHLSVIQYLIHGGADISLSNFQGYTPLHYAAKKGHTEILELLISKGAAIDSISESGTPLQCAATEGKKDTLKVLLAHNANPNLVSNQFLTPLILSILAESPECLLLLLEAGADPNIGSFGLTPLHVAVHERRIRIVGYLLYYGADPNAVDTFQRETRREETFQLSKTKGKEAFAEKEYFDAMCWYSKAIFVGPVDEKLFSNRSLCWARLNNGHMALFDADDCVKLKPNWFKGHYRRGAALKILKNYSMAAMAFSVALQLDPDNKEIEKELMEASKLVSTGGD